MTTHPAGPKVSVARSVLTELGSWPAPLRWSVLGLLLGGVVGGVVGLVLGLLASWRTAWFAVIEVGLPSALLGAVLGLLGGSLVVLGRRLRRSPR
ncbi:hypothetical protein G7075_08505 [Phycicoccus sp. HDW14]|uniref:hypothetical protein n=1 Tax=Phycicoccus sp. HDW14 TaxID=2714941 RepID=UPI001407ACEB|nr:hypothetical protein [Phycicoccus sp. HDW14]QIM21162.1 hypothetical protein G7075_08505 [Phycicoccus sp. HDW14]